MSKSYYDLNAECFIENTVSLDMNAIYDPFLRKLSLHSRILDAGCGTGRDTLAFSKMGYQVTAFDGSKKMVETACEITGHKVLHCDFSEFTSNFEFDGIWACASLLHVPREKLESTLRSLSENLRTEGVFYASFKYGSLERQKGTRYFNDMNEQQLFEVVNKIKSLEVYQIWKTKDQRPDRSSEMWLNCLLRVKRITG